LPNKQCQCQDVCEMESNILQSNITDTGSNKYNRQQTGCPKSAKNKLLMSEGGQWTRLLMSEGGQS